MVVYNDPLDRVYQYLFIAAFFLLPLTVSGNNIAIWTAVILWLVSGNYREKVNKINENKLARASILFFCVHLLALIWTEDISWGLEITRKMLPFLFVLPIFLTLAKKENFKFYVASFLLAISISEGISYLIWFEIIEPFKYATQNNPTALMSHISYNPFLAFAIYLVLNRLLSKQKISQFERAIYTFFTLTMTVNMFITGGRAGQVMFFAAIVILAFQNFRNSQVKSTIISLLLIICISSLAYTSSPLFKNRVDSAVENIIDFKENRDTAVGQRITFFVNSYEIFKSSPIIGIGTGDFPNEYQKVNQVNSPEVRTTVQPHNMYMLVLTQLGLLGLISLLWIFYTQYKIASTTSNIIIANIGVALPLLFLLIMWSDSYLLGHYTSNLFILFSSIIYSQN
jgi:O-antigen ligase